jgi:xylan 1,4-beta-xylosidase
MKNSKNTLRGSKPDSTLNGGLGFARAWASTTPKSSAGLILAMLLLFGTGTLSLHALTLLSSNELVFVNVDHAPMGACSTMTYGYNGQPCGVGTSLGGHYPYWPWDGGVLMALSGNSGLQLLPFITNVAATTHFFPNASIQRHLTPCTDEFAIAGAGLSFTHYSPAWQMTNLSTATPSEKKRYFLPATWLVFTIYNTNSVAEDFYFGLPVSVTQKTFANGAYQGFALGEAALAVQRGSCELVTGARLSSVFPGVNQGFAFHLTVPSGQTRTLLVVIAYYRSAVVDSRTGSTYYYTSLFPSMDWVIDAAFAGFGDAEVRCQQLATALSRAQLNPFREFMASYALHTYTANTACLIDPQGGVHWWEMEGWFNYINTFDLTVDHAFFDACMQPWALRNVLDAFSGALPGTGYSFETPLFNPAGTQVSTHGYSFHHDMGLWPNSGTGPAYGANMGDEELQAWILSAGLYWSHTGDHAWLTNNLAVLQTCLNSMLLRDNTNAAARDGITKNVNANEITTWDSLDNSLLRPAFSGRLAVRNWACYLALNAMFNQVGDTGNAATCQSMAGITAATIVNRWNTYQSTLGYIPALLNGNSTAATTPMIEGLAYPAAMGLTNAIDRTGGPYAAMLQVLSNHTVAVLIPGRCLQSASGAWLSTSANQITWQSKMFIAQYAAEVVLGITNDTVNGSVDQIHVSVQLQDAPYQGYCDAFFGTGGLHGGYHYPRGITTSLWWLNASNNPTNPAASSPPGPPVISFALAGSQQVSLLWQGVPLAAAYNLKRAIITGGPYTPVTNGLVGASVVDSGLNNGTTYYYVLTATNQFGESGQSPEVSATPVPSVGSSISATISASGVTVSWPPAYVGWILQTNTIGLSTPAGWGNVPNSRTQSQMIFPITTPDLPVEFFRLRHP